MRNLESRILKRLLTMVLVIAAVLPMAAQMKSRPKTAGSQMTCRPIQSVAQQKNAQFEFVMRKAVKHQDDRLTRVVGAIVGQPHTSNRIDAVALVNGCDTIVANDIDGVDFKRYFQWEDDGVIDLEIDFPAPKGKKLPTVDSGSKLVFTTVLGQYVFNCK